MLKSNISCFFYKIKPYAEMSEWFKVQPWKGCVHQKCTGSSNLPLCAKKNNSFNSCYFLLSASLLYGHPRSSIPREMIGETISQIAASIIIT